MKKEYLYFLAGVALMGAVMFSAGVFEDDSTDCRMVAHYAAANGKVEDEDLTEYEIALGLELFSRRPYVDNSWPFDEDFYKKREANLETLYDQCIKLDRGF